MKSLILLLPTLIVAEINIQVTSKDKQHKIEYLGENVDIITDDEIQAFNLTTDNLKKCVGIYLGAQPDHTYLKDPTPWGDLYEKYDWKKVKTTIYPHKTKIISFTSTPINVLTQVFNNTRSSNAKFKAPVRQRVNNTINSQWKKTGKLSSDDVIRYTFNMTSKSGKTSEVKLLATYTSKCGENVIISEAVNAGHVSALEITLDPKQSIVVDLIAVRDILKVQIDYLASLSGSIVVNYDKSHKGHHFWSLDVNSVLDASGVPLSLRSSETIVLDYYTDSKVVIRDYQTGQVLDTVRFKIRKMDRN